MKKYKYVGPPEILQRVKPAFRGFPIEKMEDILKWIKATKQITHHRFLTATFVIDLEGKLLVADRHSEHVQCAEGQQVLSAGEITFFVSKNEIEVTELSNQSTGYCPHVNSFAHAKNALDKIGIEHPDEFTNPIVFGFCKNCEKYSIVKEGYEECGVCEQSYIFCD